MAEIASIATQSSNAPAGMHEAEWEARCELAAAYRLCALYGWTDLNNTHLSLRVPGTRDHFLLNPFGMFFEEITASSLIKVDGEGNLISDSDYPMNPAGFVIHGAIHMSGDDRHCVLHTHSRYGTAVSMQKRGLLPNSQKALTIMGWVGYHDFEGPALDESEQPRIVSDIEGKAILILRYLGLLSVGKSVGEAFVLLYRIETACRHQIDAITGGAELQDISPVAQQKSIDMGLKMYGEGGFIEAGKEWPMLLRQLERAGMDDYAR